MGLETDPGRLRALDGRFCELTKDTSLALRPGSIFRVPEMHLPMWGIKVTEDNRSFFDKQSASYYDKDERDIQGMDPVLVRLVTSTPGRMAIEERMAQMIARILTQMIEAMDDGSRKFTICDLGSRLGDLSSRIVTTLRMMNGGEDILGRTTFHLIDYSPARMGIAVAKMKMHEVRYVAHTHEDVSVLGRIYDETFDFIVSAAFLHKKTFAVDYLIELKRVLADGGALLLGDFHSRIWETPAFTYLLLDKMGAYPNTLDAFERFFEDVRFIDPFAELRKKDVDPRVTREQVMEQLRTFMMQPAIMDEGNKEGAAQHFVDLSGQGAKKLFRELRRLDDREADERAARELELEIAAVHDHKRHILEVSRQISEAKANHPTFPKRFFLGAHVSSRQRIEELGKAGFETDIAEIRKAFGGATIRDLPCRLKANSDFAAVMAGVKRRRGE